MENNTIGKIVKFTEAITSGKNFDKPEIISIFNLIAKSNRNLKVYKGIMALYYFQKFKEFPEKSLKRLSTNEIFLKCLSFLNGDILSPSEIGSTFLDILTLSDNSEWSRDILMGCFYGALWPFMNNPKNMEIAVDYGLEIVKSAFSLDNFDVQKKIKLGKAVKTVSLGGSGKKEIKLLNISSISAIITAAIGKVIGGNIVIAKTASKTTSNVTGSGDIFELIGVNLNLPIAKMVDIACKTGLGIFDINLIVPRLNRIYDGRLYNVQIFAGLVGGAAIVNPVDADLINYGLTRGSTKLCLAILNKLYGEKNIIVLQGHNHSGESVIDQISIAGATEIAQNVNGQEVIMKVTPKNFGFDYKPFTYIKTTKNKKGNLREFIKILSGRCNKELKQVVAMEVALNLFGLGLIDDLKRGAELAIETIDSGVGIEVIKNLVIYSRGDIQRFNSLINFNI
ncbi:MAG: hypothetical protein QW134_09185 [Nitrososphaeria archaeon]